MNNRSKFTLSNEAELKAKLNSVLKTSLPNFIASTNSRRAKVLSNRKSALITLALALGVLFILFQAVDSNIGAWSFNTLLVTSIIWIVVVIIFFRQWMKNDHLLAREINMALVPTFTNVLDKLVMYTHDSAHRVKTSELLKESALLTSEGLDIEADDTYTIYGENEVSVRELFVTKLVSNGKSTSRVEVFKGVFVVADLGKGHEAETYISTDGDRSGFAHRTFWSDLVESGEVKETILEWNEFEKELHVATTNPTKAREILTPDFMQDVYEWWKEHELNMRIAFKGSKLYLLLPEETIKIGTSTTSIDSKKIESYAHSLLRPIWRSVKLVEDVYS